MFLEFGQIILERYDFPNQDIVILVYMIVLPILYILRGCAIFGMSFPLFRSFHNIFFEKTHWFKLSMTIIWITLNAYIINSDVDWFWKWLWIDFLGIILFINILSFYINKLITRSK
ncbi:MAG: hypothetical protein ACRCTJ_03675 [Brevinema sp.]